MRTRSDVRNLIVRIIVEAVVGLAAAAALLAVAVPLLIRHHLIEPGDTRGALVIGSVLALAIGAMLFRPGGALRRRRQ
jgi:hypothetical protein